MLVITQILAKTSRLLSDIHYRKWIVMQIIFVGYFCRDLAAVSLFTQVKNITGMKLRYQANDLFELHGVHNTWRKTVHFSII